jgi:hypothetical protein
VARFRDADRIPDVGDHVVVVQPDADDTAFEFVSAAVVEGIDRDWELITLRVDWAAFHDEPHIPQTGRNSVAAVAQVGVR